MPACARATEALASLRIGLFFSARSSAWVMVREILAGGSKLSESLEGAATDAVGEGSPGKTFAWLSTGVANACARNRKRMVDRTLC